MSSCVRFRINKPKVILESFEDEVVMVNLESGNYFSLNRIGVEICELIESGASIQEAAEVISDAYEGDRARIELDLAGLVDRMIGEGLLVPVAENRETGGADAPCNRDAAGNMPESLGKVYVTPELVKYSDMQELLLLDPIHDVDATGWPNKSSAG
jgi:hypothetical protein